jgi:hypothetical protein
MKYDNYDDYLNKTYNHFILLKHLVFEGDMTGIDLWFSEHFDYQYELENGYLSQLIRNTTHFYAQKKLDNNHNDNPQAIINQDSILAEAKKRHLAIIKHFPAREQLALLHDLLLINDLFLIGKNWMDKDYFSLIHYSHDDKEKGFLLHSSWSRIIEECFFQEQFSLIDYIEQHFEHDFLNQSNQSMALHYQEDTFHGVTFVTDTRQSFRAYFSIMLDYNETKAAYLKNKGIELPSHQDAVFLQNKIMTRHDYPREGMVKLVGNLKTYQVQLRYDSLNAQVEAMCDVDHISDNEHNTSHSRLKI